MNLIEVVVIGAALIVIVTTALGTPTRNWEVYCWMTALIVWVYNASKYRRRDW